MAEPKFDKDGKIENLDELSVHEVADAYHKKNQEIFGRAMTAEEKLKSEAEARVKAEKELEVATKKPAEEPKTAPANTTSDDELRLIARGLSDEEIDEAKAIAKGKGISLTEALKTPIFQLFQNNLKEERKKEEAKLGASHGSGQISTDKKIKSGMTRDEHRAAFEEARANLT